MLGWYHTHKRSLPWRQTQDPYAVLLSEILLQQTRVDQAIPYYHRFLAAFPTLADLAKADLETVLKVWQGLGYYARARNLHKLAQQLGTGQLPNTYSALLELPGIGPYTAAAVASIAFGEPKAAVDGNIRRVLSRLEAWELPSPQQVQAKADALMASTAAAGDWNQALMELGATLCTPQNPKCSVCPIAAFCRGKADPQRYPAPKERKQKEVNAVALVLQGPNGVHLEPRKGKILGGLWGVPLHEGSIEALVQSVAANSSLDPLLIGTISHAFTHRKLTVQVYTAAWDGQENPQERPLSRLDRKILELAEKSRHRFL